MEMLIFQIFIVWLPWQPNAINLQTWCINKIFMSCWSKMQSINLLWLNKAKLESILIVVLLTGHPEIYTSRWHGWGLSVALHPIFSNYALLVADFELLINVYTYLTCNKSHLTIRIKSILCKVWKNTNDF